LRRSARAAPTGLKVAPIRSKTVSVAWQQESFVAATLEPINDASASSPEQHPREKLADETFRWLASLPEDIRPEEMPVRFPRFANALALRWIDRDACRAYLEDLLIDKRGTRRGLPSEVADELATLKNYVETVLYPAPQTVWDEIAERRRNR
jgi:hypothetical protein